MLKPLCFVLFVTLAIPSAKAQNIQTDRIQWNVASFTDMNHNTVVDTQSQFISNGDLQVDWVQSDGSYVNTFSVTGAPGSWSDIEEFGSVTYSVSAEPLIGEIVFSRDNDGISITLNLTGGTYPINLLFQVSTVEKL